MLDFEATFDDSMTFNGISGNALVNLNLVSLAPSYVKLGRLYATKSPYSFLAFSFLSYFMYFGPHFYHTPLPDTRFAHHPL